MMPQLRPQMTLPFPSGYPTLTTFSLELILHLDAILSYFNQKMHRMVFVCPIIQNQLHYTILDALEKGLCYAISCSTDCWV